MIIIFIIIIVVAFVQQFLLYHWWEWWFDGHIMPQEYMWHEYWHTTLINVHQEIWECGIFIAVKGNICCCHIFCGNMVNKCCSLLILMYACSNIGLYVDYIYVKCDRHICSATYASHMENMYTVLLVTLALQWVHMKHIFWHSCLISAYEAIGICGI